MKRMTFRIVNIVNHFSIFISVFIPFRIGNSIVNNVLMTTQLLHLPQSREFLAVDHVVCKKPLVIVMAQAFPLDQILNEPTPPPMIQHCFDLILRRSFNELRHWN